MATGQQQRRVRQDKRVATPEEPPITRTCPPGWAWLLAGVFIGIFISFLVYLREIAPYTITRISTPPPTIAADTRPSSASQPSASTPSQRFEFYDMLSNKGNAKPPKTTRVSDTPRTATPVDANLPIDVSLQSPGPHVLQVGSYRDLQNAEELKARLASMGIQAVIQQIASANSSGEQWHRVRIGPFNDVKKLNQIRAQLAANNVAAIILPVQQ